MRGWPSDPAATNPALFLNRYGHRLSVGGMQKQLGVYCRQAGAQLTCHQLRHSFGRHLTEAQVPITTTQRLLGHAQLRTTQIYTHLSNRQAQSEYDSAMGQISEWLGQESETAEVWETSAVLPVGAGGAQ